VDWIKRKWNLQNGFTLIEVLIAIVIISALVGTFAPLRVSSVRHIEWAGRRTSFVYAGRSKMERTMALASEALDTATDWVTITQQQSDSGPLEWQVSGTLVISKFDEEGSDRDILVSFVVPKGR